MQIENLQQGTPDWLEFRSTHFGASEAAAMLGISSKVKRTELLHIKHTGNAKEFSDWVQKNILDYGHEVEAMARPLVEAMIGEDLYPVTCSNGALSASCDGLTMGEDIAFEHKQWNESLAKSVGDGVLPEEYMPQCQQILMVTGAQKLIFVCSDGTRERFQSIEVFPNTDWFQRITAGWEQFAKDLANYTPKLLAEKPEADAIKNLPALAIQIKGEVLNSNLPAFKEAAEAFISQINTDLTTDEDFANAEATVKYCADVEENLALTKKAIIAQTATIEDVMLTIDQVSGQIRNKRLTLAKLVQMQKDAIRASILSDVKLAYSEHVAALEAEMHPIRLVYTTPDFAGAMKNKRTLSSLHDSVDTLLANAKITTNEQAADLRTKLQWIKTEHPDFGFLFMDLQTIIHKATDDFQLLVNTRVKAHQDAEAAKAEALRKQIAAEEQAKAEKSAAEKVAAEQAAIAEQQRKEADAAAGAQKAATPATVETIAQVAAPITMAASAHSPVPVRNNAPAAVPASATQVVPVDDSQIIDVLMDVFNWTESQAIERLAKFDFAAARKNLVATAA